VYSNGSLIHQQPDLSPVNVSLPNAQSSALALFSNQQYTNILANPNAPWGYPNATADYLFSTNSDYSPYEAWKLIDGLLWYDTTPDNRWTNNQSTTPYNKINITLSRPRNFSSVSLAIIDDTARHGVIACPSAITVSLANGSVIAERNPWASCNPNALNTILFDKPNIDPNNITTPSTGFEIETDHIQITLWNQIHYAVAVSEIQIWVPTNPGPRYEVEDGLLGTFIGGFEGRRSGLNCSVGNGGVYIREGGWAELADVRTSTGKGGNGTLRVIGGGSGTVNVQMNFLQNSTVTFGGGANETRSANAQFLDGGNYVTIFWVSGEPWVDAILVGS
jgi:hypothetical protein